MTSKPQRDDDSKQDAILNFIDDPENIKKAVEGSMDKRAAVLADADLRAALLSKASKIVTLEDTPNARAISNLPDDEIVVTLVLRLDKLLDLFHTAQQQLLSELEAQKCTAGVVDASTGLRLDVDWLPVSVLEHKKQELERGK